MTYGPITLGPAFWFALSVTGGLVALITGWHMLRVPYLWIEQKISKKAKFSSLTSEIAEHRRNTEITIKSDHPFPTPSSLMKERISLQYLLSKIDIPTPDLEEHEKWLIFLVQLEVMAENQLLKGAITLLARLEELNEMFDQKK